MTAISAHRGGAERFSPATYEAYRDACAGGADLVELDIRRLADGVLAVFHDEHVADGRALSGLTHGQLCRAAGYDVPVLDVLVAEIPARVRLHLDLKETGDEEQILEIARRHGDFVATSLEDAALRRIRELAPAASTALSLGRSLEGMSRAAALSARYGEVFPTRRLADCAADGIALNARLARLGGLRRAERLGLDVLLWTVDDDAEIQAYLADPRVDVLVTNRPHRALELANRA